jgi:hypothetical protein
MRIALKRGGFMAKWPERSVTPAVFRRVQADPAHVAENVTALKGALADSAMRERMFQHVQSLPGFEKLAEMPWYPGKKFAGLVAQAQNKIRSRG